MSDPLKILTCSLLWLPLLYVKGRCLYFLYSTYIYVYEIYINRYPYSCKGITSILHPFLCGFRGWIKMMGSICFLKVHILDWFCGFSVIVKTRMWWCRYTLVYSLLYSIKGSFYFQGVLAILKIFFIFYSLVHFLEW